MAMNAEVAAIDQGFTQKMGRCQTRSDALQVSEFRFDPVYLHRGEVSGSEPKGEIP